MMKALEIEDAEVESFLDDEDHALNDTRIRRSANGNSVSMYSSKSKQSKPDVNDSNQHPWTRTIGVVAALLVILLYLSGIGFPNENASAAGVEIHQAVHHASNATPAPYDETELPSDDEEAANGEEASSQAETTPSEEAPPPDGSDTSSSTTSSSSNQAYPDHEYLPLFYSHMATVVPDPYHSPISDEEKAALAEKWGKWHFWDGDEKRRPSASYCSGYPNCDLPGDQFPDSAWQVDGVFVNHILDDADKLLSRVKEAIYSEYGHGKPLPPEGLMERYQMFSWEKVDLKEVTSAPPRYSGKRGTRDTGGWTTARSQDGLVRRILHAIMTSDEFTVVLGGHSAAAGHGNNFHQSYIMQFHQVMAPIFARLGVKLVTRNISQGGLGTLQNSLGFADLYGDAIDLLIWDSGMTETEQVAIDIFYRQALLSGRKVPVIWNGPFPLLRALHEFGDADVGEFGSGMLGIPETPNEVDAAKIPYAARYLKCPPVMGSACNDQKFCARCWLPRDDLPQDPKQLFPDAGTRPGGQVGWHPGWRQHRLTGRVLAFAVIDALQSALQIFSDGTMNGPPLDEDYWHVTAYYENIRNKVRNMPEDAGACYTDAAGRGIPNRVCNTPLKGRGEHTPRFNPERSSVTSIVRPDADGYVPHNDEKMLYEGLDAHNPCDDIPKGEVDVLAIVGGRRLGQLALPEEFSLQNAQVSVAVDDVSKEFTLQHKSRALDGDIVPGKGWQLILSLPGQCDGSYYSICGRESTSKCPAYGHHDSRGMISGNEFSGWLIMDLPNVKEGLIILKIITWLSAEGNTRTSDWTTVNNEGAGGRQLGRVDRSSRLVSNLLFNGNATLTSQAHRHLVTNIADLPETFAFDYAINGKVTSLSKNEFIERRKNPQRVVELITLLDDPNFTENEIPVEVAIRMRGCERECTFAVSHIYWA